MYILYSATLLLLELNSKKGLYLLQIYGNINNNRKYLLTLCFINNARFKVIYEKNKSIENRNNLKLNDRIVNIIIKNNVKLNNTIKIKFPMLTIIELLDIMIYIII